MSSVARQWIGTCLLLYLCNGVYVAYRVNVLWFGTHSMLTGLYSLYELIPIISGLGHTHSGHLGWRLCGLYSE